MSKSIVPVDRIARTILVLRGEKVLLDVDLARLYGVITGNLNKAVQRNRERFPADFMFQLTAEEARDLKFQFGVSSRGGLRTRPLKQPRREIGFHVREKSARYRTRNGR
jgi:ORF6N domain